MVGQGGQSTREARPGLQQGGELSGCGESIESPESSHHPLAGAAAFPAVFDDLEVNVAGCLFLSEEHGAFLDTMTLAQERASSSVFYLRLSYNLAPGSEVLISSPS